MSFFYAALWVLIGVVLIWKMAKENKVFYLAGGFFLLLGAWWAADGLFPDSQVFSGGLGIALKIVTLIALVVLGAVFFIERNRNIKKELLLKKQLEKDQISEADPRRELEEEEH